MIQPIILSRLNSINHYFIITNTGSVIWNGSTVEWLRLGGGGGGGGGGGLSVVEFGWIRNIPTQKSEQPLLELARDEVFFPPQDTILLLNTCQKDLVQSSEIFARVSHVQSHMHKNCYEELLTQIVPWERSGLTRYNIKTFTTILKFPKTHSTAGLLQRQDFAYRTPELQKNIL